MDNTETIISYRDGDVVYDVDHLGVCSPNMWGWFVVYRGAEWVAEFVIAESILRPEFQSRELPVSNTEITRLAREAVHELDRCIL